MVYVKEQYLGEWHPTLNDNPDPHLSMLKLKDKAWWVCSLEHEWEATITNRNRLGSGCPYCVGQKAWPGFNDIDTTDPFLAKIWSSKNEFTSKAYVSGHRKKVWWLEECGHEYQMSPVQRKRALKCQVCVNRVIIPGVNDLQTTVPDVAAEWHPTLNGELLPTQVSKGKPLRVWWVCKSRHEWSATINDRVAYDTWCPTCSGKRIEIGFNDLQTTHPEIAIEWHPTLNGELTPEHVTKGHDKKVWWLCSIGHVYDAVVYSRTGNDKTGCAVCAGRRLLIGFNDFATKQPQLIKEWHPTKNGELQPHEFTPRSAKKIWWVCKRDHVWETTISNRTVGKGCQKCHSTESVSKAEKEIIDFVSELNVVFETSNRKLLKGKELDIFFPDLNFAIEYNGLFWHSEHHKPKSYHYDKYVACKSLGIDLLQIWEHDWEHDTESVQDYVRVSIMKRVQLVSGAVSLSDVVNVDEDLLVSNDSGNALLYQQAGLVEREVFEPDYKYLMRHSLVDKFSVETFDMDEKLIFDTGCSLSELENLNNLNRVWDSGKTLWVLK